MIPSVAFGAASTEKVRIGTTDYTVTFNSSEFNYNAKKQVPTVTFRNSANTVVSPSGIELKYSKVAEITNPATQIEANPTEAGTYYVYAMTTDSSSGSSQYIKLGSFDIKKISLTDSNIKLALKKNTTINSSIINEINTLISNSQSTDSKLKEYFELLHGTTAVNPDNYTLSCSVENNDKTLLISVANTSEGSFTDSSLRNIEFNLITSISNYYVEAKGTDFMYTGKTPVPELIVKPTSSSQESEALVKGTDYTVTCTGGTKVEDKVTVIVKGIGTYTGEIKQDFKIKKYDISGTNSTVTPEVLYIPQGATSIDLTVKCGDNILVRERDYTVSAVDTSQATAAESLPTLTITGQGNYEGTKAVNYKVLSQTEKDIQFSTIYTSNLTYNGSAQTPSITLKIGNETVTSSYYNVQYRLHGTNGAFSSITPTDVGVYDIGISLVSGQTKYSNSGANPKVFSSAFEINKLDISSSSVTATYSGSSSNPVTLRLGSKTLTRYTDYDVDNYSASKTSYTVTGKGNFTGTRTVYAEIRNMSSCSASFSDGKSSGLYGSTYYPDVNVYYGSTRLVKNSDYTVTYKNSSNQTVYYCKDIGTYSVIITGTGSYTGTKTLYFTVEGNDISGYTVTLKNPTVTATDYAQYPVIESVKKSYYTLSSADYTVSYLDAAGKAVISPKEPGTYRVVLTGKNAYTGSTYAYFTITALPQTVTVEKESYKAYYNYSDPFMIDAVGSASATLTYTSSNPAVASVSSAGIVTVNKVGRAVITVTAPATGKYAAASKEVVVKVYPKKAVISRAPWTDGKKKQAKVRWYYQPGATYYQVRYTRDKDFDPDTYLTRKVTAYKNNYTTQTTTIKNLRSGYRYYFKVRAVYKDEATGAYYYGNWSNARSVVVK